MPRIENWAIGFAGDEYTAPELRVQIIFGTVYGHSQLEDGTSIRTSSVTKLDLSNRIAVTRNTTYTLGKPDPDYVKEYPETLTLLGKEEKGPHVTK